MAGAVTKCRRTVKENSSNSLAQHVNKMPEQQVLMLQICNDKNLITPFKRTTLKAITNTPSAGGGSVGNKKPKMVNLNSEVSLIPVKSVDNQIPSDSNLHSVPTIDLTNSPIKRKTMSKNITFICHICDKMFPSRVTLNAHIDTHKNSPKQLLYRCNQCNVMFRTHGLLIQHKTSFHKSKTNRAAVNATANMMIPVVDLNRTDVISRLRSLGVRQFIPFNNSASQKPGCGGPFVIPIIESGDKRLISQLGSSYEVSLGPLKFL